MDERYGITASVGELVAQRPAGRRIGPATRKPVRTVGAGQHAAAFRGRGMEFEETRAYQAGDDVRAIDWRVTARTGRVHTKLFHEERERPVVLLLDQRPHMRFGTRDAFKSVVAARAAATVAWCARDGGDRVGALILGTPRFAEGVVPPQRSRARLLHLLHTISAATSRTPAGAGSEPPPSLADALSLLARTSRPGTLLYLISDFSDLDERTERELARLGRGREVVCVLVYDRLEEEAPRAGDYRVSDGTRVATLATGDPRWRAAWSGRFLERAERLERLCRERGMKHLRIATGEDCGALLRVRGGER
jgi:uncharacterized protein (DUF58 family)